MVETELSQRNHIIKTMVVGAHRAVANKPHHSRNGSGGARGALANRSHLQGSGSGEGRALANEPHHCRNGNDGWPRVRKQTTSLKV